MAEDNRKRKYDEPMGLTVHTRHNDDESVLTQPDWQQEMAFDKNIHWWGKGGEHLGKAFVKDCIEAGIVVPDDPEKIMSHEEALALMAEDPGRSILMMGASDLNIQANFSCAHRNHNLAERERIQTGNEVVAHEVKVARLKLQEANSLKEFLEVEASLKQDQLALNEAIAEKEQLEASARKFACDAKKAYAIREILHVMKDHATEVWPLERMPTKDVRKLLKLTTTKDVEQIATREQIKGYLRILAFGRYERNEEFRIMWTGGFVPTKATSIDSMETWREKYGQFPKIKTGSGTRHNLALRLCHYLQLDEPEDLSIHPDTPTEEKFNKLKTLTSIGNLSQEKMLELYQHLGRGLGMLEMQGELEENEHGRKKRKTLQLGNIEEGNEDDDDDDN